MVLMLWLVAACVPTSSLAVNNQYTVRNSLDSSVAIQMKGDRDWYTIGSGTVVRKNNRLYMGPEPKFAILTAQHVLEDDDPLAEYRACSDLDMSVCVGLGSYIHGDPKARGASGKDWALALVRELPEPMAPIRVRTEALELGEEIVTISHPWGDFLVAGGVCGSKIVRDGKPMYKLASYAAPGSSGGGVYDGRGRLRGIIVAIAVEEGYLDFPSWQHTIVFAVPVGNVAW